jgi:DNA polymerase-3 subunit beta
MTNEITIDVAGFKKVLDMVKGCVPSKNVNPNLLNVKLDWDKQANTFYLSASNGDQYITVECVERRKTDDGVQVDSCVHMLKDDPKAGWAPVCLPYSSLRDAFSLLPGARRCLVTLQQKDDGTTRTMIIDYQDGKLSLPYDLADEFPTPPELAAPDTDGYQCRFQVDGATLLNAVRAAKTCTADDELRPVMNSVCLDCFIDSIVVVASDGHKFYKHVLETPGYLQKIGFPVDQSTRLLVPKQTMACLNAAFDKSEKLTVCADTQRIQFSIDGVTLTTRCIEGHYPNYESVIPKDNPYKVQMSRESLKMALRRVQLSASTSSNMATMASDGTAFIISAEDYDFSREGSERVPVQQTDAFLPEGFKIGMKISNTLDLLDLLDEDNIVFYFSDPNHAFLLKNESPKLQNVTLLQMPMLVGDAVNG